MKRPFVLLSVFLIISGCDSRIMESLVGSNSKYADTPALGEKFFVQIGKEAYFESERMRIKFASVPMDCRCPEGALCVWEGYVEIVLNVTQTGREPLDLALSTYYDKDGITFYDYSLALIDVMPGPSLSHERDTTAYKAELILKKLP